MLDFAVHFSEDRRGPRHRRSVAPWNRRDGVGQSIRMEEVLCKRLSRLYLPIVLDACRAAQTFEWVGIEIVVTTRYNATIHDFVMLNALAAAAPTRAAVAQAVDFLKSVLAPKGNRQLEQHFVPGGGDR